MIDRWWIIFLSHIPPHKTRYLHRMGYYVTSTATRRIWYGRPNRRSNKCSVMHSCCWFQYWEAPCQSSRTSVLISIVYPIRREVDNRLITQEQSIDLHHTQLWHKTAQNVSLISYNLLYYNPIIRSVCSSA